jgi:hypothetical protein
MPSLHLYQCLRAGLKEIELKQLSAHKVILGVGTWLIINFSAFILFSAKQNRYL